MDIKKLPIFPKLHKNSPRKIRNKDAMFEEKMKKQRAERGYSDEDAWNIYSWFLEVMTPALKQMRSNLHSYPISHANLNSNSQAIQTSDGDEPELIEWKKTLDRMIFLLEEMNEETCSFKNPFEKEVNKAQKEFHKKYGIFGEKLYEIVSTEEEIAKDKKIGSRRVYSYSDDPNHPEWKELSHEYHKYERVISEYRDKCREEFFQLFSLHFWDLWD